MPADANIGGIHYRPPVNRSSSLPAPPRTSTTSPQYRPPPPPPSRGFSGAIGRVAQAVSPRGVAQTRVQQVAARATRTRAQNARVAGQGVFRGGANTQILRQWLTGSGGLANINVPFKMFPVVRPPGGDTGNPRYIGFGGRQNAPIPGFTGPGAANWDRNNPWQSRSATPPVPQQYRIAARSWGLSPNDPYLVPKIDALKARVLQQSPRATPSQSRAANRANQLYTLADTLAGTFGSSYVDNPMRRISP